MNDPKPLIFFCSMKSLYSINANSGKPNLNFGDSGSVKIKKLFVTPVIIRDQLIIATFEPALKSTILKQVNLNGNIF